MDPDCKIRRIYFWIFLKNVHFEETREQNGESLAPVEVLTCQSASSSPIGWSLAYWLLIGRFQRPRMVLMLGHGYGLTPHFIPSMNCIFVLYKSIRPLIFGSRNELQFKRNCCKLLMSIIRCKKNIRAKTTYFLKLLFMHNGTCFSFVLWIIVVMHF